jgi:PA14 domain
MFPKNLKFSTSIIAIALSCPDLLLAGEPGKMTREIWNGIPGTAITDFTSSPRFTQPADSVTTFTGASAPQNFGDNFASRVRGTITAPLTGDYTFWITSDDTGELRISPTSSKCGRVKIASVPGWAPALQWDTYPAQKSASVQLVAGQKYFIEALHKDSLGGDHVSIAWQIPGGSREVIPASALESFTTDPNDVDDDDLPDSWELVHGLHIGTVATTPASQLPGADPDKDGYSNLEESTYNANPNVRGGMPGTLLLETWYTLFGTKLEALTYSNKFFGPADRSDFLFSAETPFFRAENFGARMSGYVIAPTTGSYEFYVAGDDQCRLFLSPSASEFAKVKIGHSDRNTNVKAWDTFASQKSAPVPLVAGQKYYIEGLMKEGWNGDHLEIGWKTPGSTTIAVIPGSALESYAYDAEDPDGDHMPSAWETANGLNPTLHDGALDSDSDAIPNSLEFINGSNPQVKNSMPGALLQELWWNVPGNRTASLDTEPRLLQVPNERSLACSAQGTEERPDHYANRLRGYITAPVTGTYTFWAAGDDEVDLFLSTSASKYDKKLIVHPNRLDRNFDADPSMKSRPINLIAGQKYYIEMRHIDGYWSDFCEAAWQVPGGQREIIPGTVLSTYTITADDLDDDYLPDAWELANGLDPTDNGRLLLRNGHQGDLDADGLTNAAEHKAGTRANLADTDGDGVNDREEIELLETSAILANAVPFQNVATLPGASYTAATGAWIKENGSAKQDSVRGGLSYPVTLAAAGVYQLDLAFTPVADAAVSRDYEIVFSVDNHNIQRQTVTIPADSSGRAKVLTPWLKAGAHTLRVFVDNSYHFRRVKVDSLSVLAARGADANTNGTPDWVDSRLAKYNSCEAPIQSFTSPVCLEGKAKWNELTTVAGVVVKPAPDDRWYLDVPLKPSQLTVVQTLLENGGLVITRPIKWIPINLMANSTINLRVGDSLKFTAFTGNIATSKETVGMVLAGQNYSLLATQPAIYKFTTAGKITTQISHRLDGILTTKTVVFNVVAPPLIESPVCVLGHYREVTTPPLSAGISLQMDKRIDVHTTIARPDGGAIHTLRLANLRDFQVVTRIGTTGPILGTLPFRAMRVRSADSTAVFRRGSLGNDTWDIGMPVIVDNPCSGIVLKFDIFIGGVTFDDGTISKVILVPDDLTPEGECQLGFIKVGSDGSNCHRLGIWQGLNRLSYGE